VILPWVNYLVGLLPWDLWLFAGAAGVVASIMLVPSPFKAPAVGLIVGLCLWNAGVSKGTQMGAEQERAYWKIEVARERLRLHEEFAALQDLEADRQEATETLIKSLEEQVANAVKEAQVDTSGTIIVPEPVARGLWGIGGQDIGEGDGAPRGSSLRARAVQRVFRPRGQASPP
jgi:hypothetical protein